VTDLRTLARVADVPPGAVRRVELDGRHIALFNIEGCFYAVEDNCTHRGGPLSQGQVSGTAVMCPWHGAQFDLATGNAMRPPASRGVTVYRVIVDGGDIKIE